MNTLLKAGLLFATVSVLAAAGLMLVSGDDIPPREKAPWKTGYWIWAGEPPISAQIKPEILYVQVHGRQWPRQLPEADEFVIVRRIEPGEALTKDAAAALVHNYNSVVADAGGRIRIAGLQIDYDCPTARLNSYGRFLKDIREELPADSRLSITALLDWFGPSADFRDVSRWVDEFVPQFYDAGPHRASAGIAEPIDAAKWATLFNVYQTPYRIGASSFGRIARRRLEAGGHTTIQYFRDANPLDFSGLPQLSRSTGATSAGELVVRYDVVAPIANKPELRPGDVVEITFPTDESVRRAEQAARRFGGYAAGVLFFRWPNRSERLAFGPDDVRRILTGETPSKPKLEMRSAACIERQCSDLYLDLGRAPTTTDQAYAIRTSGPLELFLPEGPLRPTAVGASAILVSVPAYAGIGTVYLGRTISRERLHFEATQR